MVQPFAAFKGQIAPGKKSFQYWPDAGGAGRQNRYEREGSGRAAQRAIALRRSVEARSERRACEGEPRRGEEEDRAPEAESEKVSDASATTTTKRQEAGQERSAKGSAERPTAKGPATEERSGSTAAAIRRQRSETTTSQERQEPEAGTEAGRISQSFPRRSEAGEPAGFIPLAFRRQGQWRRQEGEQRAAGQRRGPRAAAPLAARPGQPRALAGSGRRATAGRLAERQSRFIAGQENGGRTEG